MGALGQPAARVLFWNDEALNATTYNTQGRRYAVSQELALGDTVTATASVWVPAEWVDNTPNTAGCNVTCGRYVQFAAELGYEEGGESQTKRECMIVNLLFSRRYRRACSLTRPLTPCRRRRPGAAASYEPRFEARLGLNNRNKAFLNAGPYLALGLYTPTELLGLDSGAHAADGWPTSARGTPLKSEGMPVPAGYTAMFAGVLRTDAWNNFALSFTRLPFDPVVVNGSPRGCQEVVKMEW